MLRIMLLLYVFMLGASAADPDLFDGVVWADGNAHTADEFKGQSVVVIYFSGQCPRAGAFMRDMVKQGDALIEAEKAPVRLVCITPDLKPAELVGWVKDHGYVGTLVGCDQGNRFKISLNNIMQQMLVPAAGRVRSLFYWDKDFITFVRDLCKDHSAGKFRLDVAKPTQAAVATLWWACERERPDAIKNLAAAKKQVTNRKDDDPVKVETLALFAAVNKVFTEERDRLLAAAPGIDIYEQLENLVRRHEGLETKPAIGHLRELAKDKAMKRELSARDAWNTCQEMLRSPKPSSQKSGREALAFIVKTYPETKYGKLAAQ